MYHVTITWYRLMFLLDLENAVFPGIEKGKLSDSISNGNNRSVQT